MHLAELADCRLYSYLIFSRKHLAPSKLAAPGLLHAAYLLDSGRLADYRRFIAHADLGSPAPCLPGFYRGLPASVHMSNHSTMNVGHCTSLANV